MKLLFLATFACLHLYTVITPSSKDYEYIPTKKDTWVDIPLNATPTHAQTNQQRYQLPSALSTTERPIARLNNNDNQLPTAMQQKPAAQKPYYKIVGECCVTVICRPSTCWSQICSYCCNSPTKFDSAEYVKTPQGPK